MHVDLSLLHTKPRTLSSHGDHRRKQTSRLEVHSPPTLLSSNHHDLSRGRQRSPLLSATFKIHSQAHTTLITPCLKTSFLRRRSLLLTHSMRNRTKGMKPSSNRTGTLTLMEHPPGIKRKHMISAILFRQRLSRQRKTRTRSHMEVSPRHFRIESDRRRRRRRGLRVPRCDRLGRCSTKVACATRAANRHGASGRRRGTAESSAASGLCLKCSPARLYSEVASEVAETSSFSANAAAQIDYDTLAELCSRGTLTELQSFVESNTGVSMFASPTIPIQATARSFALCC